MEKDKATSIPQFLNIFFKIVGLGLLAWLPIEQVSRGYWYNYDGTGFGFAVSAYGQWGTHPQLEK